MSKLIGFHLIPSTTSQTVWCSKSNSVLVLDKIEDELEMTTVCYRPEGLEQLEAQTNFTKKELQVLYRGFKNVRW